MTRALLPFRPALLLLTLTVSGCVMTPRLGYAPLQVERPIFDDAVSTTPIAFRLDPRIPDAFVAKSVTGIKDIQVTEYRRTLLAGAASAFPRAQVVEAIPAEGFGVTLVEARPQAVKVSAIARGSGSMAYTEYEVRCEVTFGFSIHKGGAATNVTGQVTSKSTANSAAQMGPVCAEGLQAMFAEMRKRVAGELGASR